MSADPALIARRRHTLTILLRLFVLAWAAWSLWLLANDLIDIVWGSVSGISVDPAAFMRLPFVYIPRGAAILAILLLERRIVAWVVPVPSPEPICPKCGYSLKNLKSPVCPECGMNLK